MSFDPKSYTSSQLHCNSLLFKESVKKQELAERARHDDIVRKGELLYAELTLSNKSDDESYTSAQLYCNSLLLSVKNQ